MERFQFKYRIPSTRLQNWNYGWNGIYFVTICTAGHEQTLGYISKGKMSLSQIGQIAQNFWIEIPRHFEFIELDAFVVMPNHIHGILIISKKDDGRYDSKINPAPSMSQGQNRYQNQGKNTLSSIIGSYKSIVSRHAHYIYSGFNWQERFYDNIIRSDTSFDMIRNYIENNPLNWGSDKFFKS
jgi:REP element-mobilizing transposase RayT